MGDGNGAISAVLAQDSFCSVKLAAVLQALQGKQHLLHQVVDVEKLQTDGGVADGDGKIAGNIVAEGGYRGIIIGAAPFTKEIGKTVDQHLGSRLTGIREEQLLPCFFAPAVVAVVAAYESGLDGRRQHHGASVAVRL